MKRSTRSIGALLVSLLLVAQFTMPVRAAQIQPQFETLAPASAVIVNRQLQVSGPMPGDEQDYVTAEEEAAQLLREGLQARKQEIAIPFYTQNNDDQLMYDILMMALAHTGDPTQGDYLQWHLGKVWMLQDGYSTGTEYYLTLTFTPEYYTTAAQEAELDAAVDALLDQLDVYDAGDYEKVCAIYDYLCQNVTYDYAGLAAGSDLVYTAYAALINGTAVCQGYANLFYRLALELNVDARLIPGTGAGGNHGWNIVELDGKYYNLDATWDANNAQTGREYRYFLRSQENFPDHSRKAEYNTAAFHADYPMGEENYTPAPEAVPGDIDGDRTVTRADVIRLLLYVTLPSRYPINVKADFTGDDSVTRADVIRLLLYVTLPGRYPLT